jgi:hypothetical protein
MCFWWCGRFIRAWTKKKITFFFLSFFLSFAVITFFLSILLSISCNYNFLSFSPSLYHLQLYLSFFLRILLSIGCNYNYLPFFHFQFFSFIQKYSGKNAAGSNGAEDNCPSWLQRVAQICLSVCLYFCLSVCLSIGLYVCLSACFFIFVFLYFLPTMF